MLRTATYTLRQQEEESTFLEDVRLALMDALDRHPEPRHSIHEAFAYLHEEVDELWDEVRRRQHDPASIYIELTHVVVTAWRMATECGLIDS